MKILRILRFIVICLVASRMAVPQFAAQQPVWWTDDLDHTRVIAPHVTADNYAPANLGQLKYVATQAKKHLDLKLAALGGAGDAVSQAVAGFEPRSGQGYTPEQIAAYKATNYAPITVGQLKAVVQPFYDRLHEVGYDSRANLVAHGYPSSWASFYPWDPNDPSNQSGTEADKSPNYAMANIGQLKMAFSFDLGLISDSTLLPGSELWAIEQAMSTTNPHPAPLDPGLHIPGLPNYGTPSPGGGGNGLLLDRDHDPNSILAPHWGPWLDASVITHPDGYRAAFSYGIDNMVLDVRFERSDDGGAWVSVPVATDDQGYVYDGSSFLLANQSIFYRLRVTYMSGQLLYSNVAQCPAIPLVKVEEHKQSSKTEHDADFPPYYSWLDGVARGAKSGDAITKFLTHIELNPSATPATQVYNVFYTSPTSQHGLSTSWYIPPFVDYDFIPGADGEYIGARGVQIFGHGYIPDVTSPSGETNYGFLDTTEQAAGTAVVGAGRTGQLWVPVDSTPNTNFIFTISDTSQFWLTDGNGTPLISGRSYSVDSFFYGEANSDGNYVFYVGAKDNAQDGAVVEVKLDVYMGDGTLVGEDSIKFTARPALQRNVPLREISGSRYRKIATNGRPLPDEKPQRTPESDQEKEETYVDALTLTLHHSTTDIYVPIAGGDLALSARRNSTSEIWNMFTGLRPHERPDRPFGPGWSSNICVTEEWVVGADGNLFVYVTDQNGVFHRFGAANFAGFWRYVPLPSDSRENGDYLSSLSADGRTFTDRYGTTITFDLIHFIEKDISTSRYGQLGKESHGFCPASSIKDRFGNTITYNYPANSLIPLTITYAGGVNQTISIEQDDYGHITRLWDPNGNQFTYTYADRGYGYDDAASERVLTSVTGPDGNAVQYDYALSAEPDGYPEPPPEGLANLIWHLDVRSITDPNQNQYTFTYGFDHTRQGFSNGIYFPRTGGPSCVTAITLPDGVTQTTFSMGDSLVTLGWQESNGQFVLALEGIKELFVKDAKGNQISYAWTGGLVGTLGKYFQSIFTLQPQIPDDPNIIYYTQMEVNYGAGYGTETFTFDSSAGMALKDVTDISGNKTSYTYGDAYVPAGGSFFPILTGTPDYGLNYSDPTEQKDLFGNSKTFTYADASRYRIMTSVTDEESRTRTYDVDARGRRTSETIYEHGTGSPVVQKTLFEYGDVRFPGIITKKTVLDLAGAGVSNLVTKYVPDGNGRVIQEIIDPDHLALTTKYNYDLNGNKLSVTDPNGNQTWFTYDARNRLTQAIHPDGSAKLIDYDDRGNRRSVTDENGHSVGFTYDGLNRVLTQTQTITLAGIPTQVQSSFAYANAVDPKTSATDPKGNVTTFEYDDLQRLKKATDALNHSTCYKYDGGNAGAHAFDSSGFKPTSIKDPRGYVTTMTYDALYRLKERSAQYQLSPALYSITKNSYDKVGNATAFATLPTPTSDFAVYAPTVEYDALNRAVHVTYPRTSTDGGVPAAETRAFFKSTGLKWKVRDELGNETISEFDSAGRLVAMLGPPVDDGVSPQDGDRTSHLKSPKTTISYDDAGNTTALTDPLGNIRSYQYDFRNRKTDEEWPAVYDAITGQQSSPHISRGYDYVGNTIWVQDARGFTTATTYDEANRPLSVTSPPVILAGGTQPVSITTTASYDKNGNLAGTTDGNGHTTTNTYDVLNRPQTTTDARNVSVSYGYDEVGNQTSVTDGLNQTTTLSFDGLNRNVSITDATGQSTQFTYDGVNQTSRTDALTHVAQYAHDVRNRLIGVSYPGQTIDNCVYAYDRAGNFLSSTEAGRGGVADVAYTYDALHRPITETSNGVTHHYLYDLTGNRTTVQYGLPGGAAGRTITSTYDPLNRLSTLTDSGLSTSYSYDLNGNVVEKELPNGDQVTHLYDGLNRIYEQRDVSVRAALHHFLCLRDAAGNVKQVKEFSVGVPSRTVALDYYADDRLQMETITDINGNLVTATGYEYDDGGNRTKKTVDGSESTYVYGNSLNQLTSWSDGAGNGVSYSYDANGNRQTRTVGTQTDYYSYDVENRLTGLTKYTGGETGSYSYVYDYRTRRVSRSEGSATTAVVFSEDTSVQEYPSPAGAGSLPSGSPTAEYVRGSDWGGGIGGILYSVRGGVASFAHYDERGDVNARTDPGGVVTWQASYEAFGTRPAEYGTTSDRQMASSKEEDPTGLLNEGMRYRDLETGTFITRDPSGFVDGPNLYAYVRQNPWTFVDPAGLELDDPLSGGGGIQGIVGGIQGIIGGGPNSSSVDPGITDRVGDYFLKFTQSNAKAWADDLFNAEKSWLRFAYGQVDPVRTAHSIQAIPGAVSAQVTRAQNLGGSVLNGIRQGTTGQDLQNWGTKATQDAITALKDPTQAGLAWHDIGKSWLEAEVGGKVFDGILGLAGDAAASLRKAGAETAGPLRSVVQFQGMEVRAVRELSHIDTGTLEAMQQHGFAPTTVNGDSIVLHHLEQNAAGPLVEMPASNHSIWNDVQHPLGNAPGAGLSEAERATYNAWRTDYWKWRATQELSLRRILGN